MLCVARSHGAVSLFELPLHVFTVSADLAAGSPSGAKARISGGPLTARLKACRTQNRAAAYGKHENGSARAPTSLLPLRLASFGPLVNCFSTSASRRSQSMASWRESVRVLTVLRTSLIAVIEEQSSPNITLSITCPVGHAFVCSQVASP